MTPEEAGEHVLKMIDQEHAETIREMNATLLAGIRDKGVFTRDILADLIHCAFIEGVMAERFKHRKAGKN